MIKVNETLYEAEQRIRDKLKNDKSRDVVEKNALIAIIDNDDERFEKLIKIMTKRKNIDGHLRVVKD